jgi:fatty-acyl-CoA synthase
MQSTMMNYPLTLVHLLERAGRCYPRSEIVARMPDRSLQRTTYCDFYRRARALASALQRAGLERGDRVATLMWNHASHLEAYYGIPVAGGVVHTLNLRLAPEDIAYIVNDAEDRFLIVDDVLLPLFEQIQDSVHLERVFVVPLTGAPIPSAYENYEELLRSGLGEFAYPELDEHEAAGMCYTSGTTGRPPGVVYSHRSMVLHSYTILLSAVFGISAEDVVMPVVPMFHVLSWGVPHALPMIGGKLVFPGPHMDPESLLDLCEREQVTLCTGVPTMWLGMLQLLDREPGKHKLAAGMRIVVGGAAAPEAMIRGYDRHGITVIHAWGMTEMSPIGTVSRLKPHLRGLPEDQRYALRAKQGCMVPFVDARLVADDGQEVPADGITMGELQVRGPFVTGSYHKRARTPDKFTADGWFRTGDVATIDAEGYIKVCDRTKDLIKSGGEWISSVDLENAIMGHPAVAEAAVIAIPDAKWSERPLAFVVLKPGMAASGEEIKAFIAGKFPRWWLPDEYRFLDAIPRTSTGKFLKRALRQQIGARTTDRPA